MAGATTPSGPLLAFEHLSVRVHHAVLALYARLGNERPGRKVAATNERTPVQIGKLVG